MQINIRAVYIFFENRNHINIGKTEVNRGQIKIRRQFKYLYN